MSEEDNLAIMEKNLEIKNEKFINILLLGETGVGKSIFINSMANYLTCTYFKTAEEQDLTILIPSQCEISDKYGEYHTIQVGSKEDQNECLEVGMSATQDVHSYIFPIRDGSIKIRLIDSPGIGDGRGVDQDNMNCENILSYVGQFEELHAICYLFKSINFRLTVYFEYCMSQFLSRLDKSAGKNIIFIFTHTRGTNYTPGQSLPIIRKVIKEIKTRPPYADIPLNKNIFCFDNESFNYLAAIKQNIEFNSKVKENYCESWEKSAMYCNNLIEYITGNSKHSPLKPHFMQSTNAVNEARRLIGQLSQPLAEISQLIDDNLLVLQRHIQEFNTNTNSVDELKKKLYMPVIDLVLKPLEQPVTVCAAEKCAEIYKVRELSKWHYKQRCHDPCYLKGVPKEIIGSPLLLGCKSIAFTGKCKKCECYFTSHMHVYYLTETCQTEIIDVNVQRHLNDEEKILEDVKNHMENIRIRKDELEKEHDTIIKTTAKFAHFLQNSAITPFSDSYKSYIEYLITREKSLGELAKQSTIERLQKTLREYQEAKLSFDKAALESQKDNGAASVLITPMNIQENIQALYELKHTGKKIKELFESQKEARCREYKCREFVLVPTFVKKLYKKGKQAIENKKQDDQQRDAYHSQRKTENKTVGPNEEGLGSTEDPDNQQRNADQSQHKKGKKVISSNEEFCSAEDPQYDSRVDSRQDYLCEESKDHPQDDPLLNSYHEGNPVN